MPLISPRKQMQFLYRRAAGPDDFPWHEDKPTRLLEEAVASRPTRGRALDLGCGSGFYTVYLAQQGFEVTGVDFVSDAIAMARERATAAGVAVELVLDRGMLNLLRAGDVAEYRRRLFHWLAPDGDYLLDHALKRRPRDWRPIGPTKRSEAEILALFEPDLGLRAHERFAARVPLPVGPWLFFGVYWFRRPA